MEKPSLEIQSMAVSEDDGQVTFKVSVFNSENRTIYGYATARRILYDAATKQLTLCLHDNHVDENSLISMHMKEPRMKEFEANADTVMTLKLPKVLKRLKAFSETGGNAEIEILNINEADTVHIEIAQQDTPFYFNPKLNHARQLKEWGRAISTFTYKRYAGSQGGKGKN
jgi:hypothetical protein